MANIVSVVSSPYNAGTTDDLIVVKGAAPNVVIQVNLPPPSTVSGHIYTIVNNGNSDVSVAAAAGVNGSASRNLYPGQACAYGSDGTLYQPASSTR